jgi:Flp pilus assembly protein TadB
LLPNVPAQLLDFNRKPKPGIQTHVQPAQSGSVVVTQGVVVVVVLLVVGSGVVLVVVVVKSGHFVVVVVRRGRSQGVCVFAQPSSDVGQ